MPNIPYSTGKQSLEVLAGQLDGSALTEAFIAFIVENFTIDEVFGVDFVDEFVRDTREPSLFDERTLNEWATDNGYSRDDD